MFGRTLEFRPRKLGSSPSPETIPERSLLVLRQTKTRLFKLGDNMNDMYQDNELIVLQSRVSDLQEQNLTLQNIIRDLNEQLDNAKMNNKHLLKSIENLLGR